jgi:hypothetical protein
MHNSTKKQTWKQGKSEKSLFSENSHSSQNGRSPGVAAERRRSYLSQALRERSFPEPALRIPCEFVKP